MTIESNNKMVYDHILVRYGELKGFYPPFASEYEKRPA